MIDIYASKPEPTVIDHEREWVNELLKGKLSKPYFFKDLKLIISSQDRAKVYKLLGERLWFDRDGRARLWYHHLQLYYSEEEYLWLRIL